MFERSLDDSVEERASQGEGMKCTEIGGRAEWFLIAL